MFNVGDKAVFDSGLNPEEAHLNGSVVKILKVEDFAQEGEEEDLLILIEFEDGETMDVDGHELRAIS